MDSRWAKWIRSATAVLVCASSFMAVLPAPAAPSEDELRAAALKAGLDPDALLQQAASAAEDSATPPGRRSLPEDEASPVIILPGEAESREPLLPAASVSTPGDLPPSDLFGSDFFRLGPELFQAPSFGPVPEDYPLGVGDQILVDVWGEVEFRIDRLVDRDGTVILPKGGRILCAGRSLSAVEKDIRRQLSESYSGISLNDQEPRTFVSVQLGKLRAIRVFVVGEALRPGAYPLGSLSTLFTALYAAGGPSESGSYRRIELLRGGESRGILDLYGYLLEGRRQGDHVLREGDTVFIHPRGKTVSLEGAVRRSRRFELIEGETLGELLRFGGGWTAEAAPELLHIVRILPPGDRRPESPDRIHLDIAAADLDFALQDGDRVQVPRIADRIENWIEVQGNVKRPGRYAFQPGLTVPQLVRLAGGPWNDTLEERALLDRVDADRRHSSVDFDLGRQLDGRDPAIPLRPMDQLRIFSIWDLEDRPEVEISGEVRNPGTFEFREMSTLRDLILKAGGLLDSADLLHAEIYRLDRASIESRDPGSPPERSVALIQVDLGTDWLKSSESFELMPYDHVAIRKLPWWEVQRKVELRGEVVYPGLYSLLRSDTRLSSIILSAGGLKPAANVLGARIDRSRDGIGRIALDLDKALERPGSQHDPLLAAGDVITIPPVTNTIKVIGAVGFPTSVTFVKGRELKAYVEMAGGFADSADKGKTRVIYPNGVSRSLRWFGFRQPDVLPGSTILVPVKKPSQGDGKLETLREITAILASVATVWLVVDRTN